jgi:fumarate reductase subunit C
MSKLPFRKRNYQLMAVGVILLIIGFTIMALDKDPYGFGFMGITLSPIIVVIGFITEIFAILYTPNEKQQ